jgi:integrase/recombinase XerD
VLGYLTREQVTAILAAPDRRTWSGRRDAVLLATAYNTGARVSELASLRVQDVLLDRQTAKLSSTIKHARSPRPNPID